MIEDKLTKDERIRLEALAQAQVQQSRQIIVGDPISLTLATAKKFEEYIRGDESS